jgi:hypothetical protein
MTVRCIGYPIRLCTARSELSLYLPQLHGDYVNLPGQERYERYHVSVGHMSYASR